MLKENLPLDILLDKAYELVLEARFDEAMDYYYVISNKFNEEELPNELKHKYSIYNEVMILYLALNEAAIFSKKNNMDQVKEKLDLIYYYKKDLMEKTNSEKLVNYVNHAYHYVLGWYMYNFYKEKFLRDYETVHYYMQSGWLDKAINHYNNHLLKYYTKLTKYADYNGRNLLYNSLINLNRQIKLSSLKQQAYSEIAGYTFSMIKRPVIKEKVIHQPRILKNIETIKFDNTHFKKLHSLIKQNKTDEAAILYSKII